MPTRIYVRKPLTEEHKNNLSKSHKGLKHTKETRRSISRGLEGHKYTKKTKKKMSKIMKQLGIKPPTGKKENSPSWKGGYAKNSQGYILIYKPEHPFAKSNGYILHSHVVMEKIIGRYIKPKETIHHKGVHFPIKSIENKQDDSPENLQLFINNGKHMKFHSKLHKTN